MAKNITIAEDGVSRNFTAKKLKTNLQGSGSCTWIPEDEAADYCTFKELKVTANGTYKASDKNCDGFDKVKVEISADVVQQKTITTNGEYDAMQDDGRVGYAHVTVNVPGGGGGPFTVLFLDDEGNVLKKQENVPYGGYASCTALDGTVLNGLYFKGWNPVPKNVQFNMTCRPVRGDYVITPGEILDDWETIVADGGAHYPLGSYKTLVMDVPAHPRFAHSLIAEVENATDIRELIWGQDAGVTIYDIPSVSIACHVVKVAEGEDGSTSSWISDGFINFADANLNKEYYFDADTLNTYAIYTDWMNSPVRKWLNEDFYNALPIPLKNAVVSINKSTRSTNNAPAGTWARIGNPSQLLDKTSIDGIWVPSMKELHTFASGLSGYSTFTTSEELQGIDYSIVFMPERPANNYVGVRTIGNVYNNYPRQISFYNNTIQINAYTRAQFGFCL